MILAHAISADLFFISDSPVLHSIIIIADCAHFLHKHRGQCVLAGESSYESGSARTKLPEIRPLPLILAIFVLYHPQMHKVPRYVQHINTSLCPPSTNAFEQTSLHNYKLLFTNPINLHFPPKITSPSQPQQNAAHQPSHYRLPRRHSSRLHTMSPPRKLYRRTHPIRRPRRRILRSRQPNRLFRQHTSRLLRPTR